VKKETVLILGALSDIGKSIAHEFALNGYDLQLAARKKEKLKSLSEDLKIRYDIKVDIYEFNVLKIDTHTDFIKNLNKLPDILICTIGYMGEQKGNEKNTESRLNVLRTNYEGPSNIISEFANLFEERCSGSIVGISSVAGDRGRKNNYIYGSAKAGFTAFLSGLRNRLADKNVHVLTVLPGTVYTKMTLGLKLPKLVTTYPAKVAKDIFAGVTKKKNIIYSIGIWKLIMIIIKIIPESIFKKTNF
jgi:short-subunit dehydrogenase